MQVPSRMVVAGVLVASSCLFPALAQAQGPAPAPPARPAPELKTGWHIVRPGETLRGIASRYSGSAELWPRLHQLNPSIVNPNLIEPGQRIEIVLDPNTGTPSGQLRRLSRLVEEQPSPNPWLDAQRGDVLVERDGVRTASSSSAEIEFTDGARLTLTEDSLVFLRRTGGALRAGAKKEVEIVQGQADFEARGRGAGAATAPPEVELIVGSARASTGADDKGVAQTRARRAEGGAAKLMVYGGRSEVAAGGAKVAVAAGMGTSVESQGPPSPPEKLLPAPTLAEPEDGAQRACATPQFAWRAVEGARSYVLELCKDAGCAELLARKTDLAAARWRAEGLAVGDLYWRVTARSASGLDGYPSATSRLTLLSPRATAAAPAGSLQVSGPSVRVGDRLYIGAATKLTVAVAAAGADWAPAVDGQAVDRLPASWSAGDHTVTTAALDSCGNRVVGAPIPFTVDTAPPALAWQLGSRRNFEEKGVLAPDGEEKRRRNKGAEAGRPPKGFWPSQAGVWQVPLPWNRERRKRGLQPVLATEPLVILSDHPQVFVRLRGSRLSVDGKDLPGDEGSDVLRIAAEDDGAGVERLTLQERVEQDRIVLQVESADTVGNVSRREIVVRSDGRSRP